MAGILGLLLRAKRAGLVPAVRPLIDAAVVEGFHVRPELYRVMLDLAGEALLDLVLVGWVALARRCGSVGCRPCRPVEGPKVSSVSHESSYMADLKRSLHRLTAGIPSLCHARERCKISPGNQTHPRYQVSQRQLAVPKPPMTRDAVLDIPCRELPTLRDQCGIEELASFGSFAAGQAATRGAVGSRRPGGSSSES